MPVSMISYDLDGPNRNYEGVKEAIEECTQAYWHCLGSTWVIQSSMSAADIRDRICNHTDSGDQVLVARLSGEAAWSGFNQKGTDWLKGVL